MKWDGSCDLIPAWILPTVKSPWEGEQGAEGKRLNFILFYFAESSELLHKRAES